MRSSVVAVLALAIAAGCGRLGFDATGDVGPLELTIATATTSNPEFEDIPGGRLDLPPSVGTRWLLLVTATLQSSSLLDLSAEARYLVDGVERGIGGSDSDALDRPGPWQHLHVIDGRDVPIAITFQLRDARGATARIDDLRAVAVPLPADSDLYAADDGVMEITSPEFVALHTLTLEPQLAGDHVVLLLVNATEAPDQSDITVRWIDPGGAVVGADAHIPRRAWQALLLARRIALPAGPSTFSLEARTNGRGSIAYARALALRVDAFGDRFAYADNLTTVVASDATRVLTTELRPEVRPANAYVVLGTMRADVDACSGVGHERGVHYDVDGDASSIVHLPGNCAYEASYGLLRLRASAPEVVSASISAPNGDPVVHDESALVVLGL